MAWSNSILSAGDMLTRSDDGKKTNVRYYCVPLYNEILLEIFGRTPLYTTPIYRPGNCPKRNYIPIVLQYYVYDVVLFVEVFSGKWLADADERERADAKMRRFQELAAETERQKRSPKVYDICAFGRQVALYVYDRDSGNIEPSHPKRGRPPIRWWNLDIVEEDGQQEFFTKVIEPIKCIPRDLEEATSLSPPFPGWKQLYY